MKKSNNFDKEKYIVGNITIDILKTEDNSNNIVERNYLKKIENDEQLKRENFSVLEFLQKNHGWFIGFLTLFVSMLVFGMTLLRFLNLRDLFLFYGLNFDIIENQDSSIILVGSLSFIVSISLICIIVSFYRIFFHRKKMKKVKCFEYFIFLLLLNFFLFYYFNINVEVEEFSFTAIRDYFLSYIILILPLLFFEFLIMLSCSPMLKVMFDVNGKNYETKDFIVGCFMLCIFMVIWAILIGSHFYKRDLEDKKSYYFIDDSTVIVYTSEDYYLTLDCEIRKDKNNDILIIYTNTQNKVLSNNIKTYRKDFYKVYPSKEKIEETKDETLFLEEGKIE